MTLVGSIPRALRSFAYFVLVRLLGVLTERGSVSQLQLEELWMSDGTEAGTVLVRDVLPGAEDASLYPLTPVGDSLFFVAADGEASNLWTSHGTERSTILLM